MMANHDKHKLLKIDIEVFRLESAKSVKLL